MRFLFLCTFLGMILFPSVLFAAENKPSTESIQVYGGTPLTEQKLINTAKNAITIDSQLITADLGTDGTAELILANGLGEKPFVKVLRQDGSEIGSFLAYEDSMLAGVTVTTCDLTGDGLNEIITIPNKNEKPRLRVFSNLGTLLTETLVYAPSMQAGVNLVCGNLDTDTNTELITLPQTGANPHLKLWKWQNNELTLTTQWQAFSSLVTDGQSNDFGTTGVIFNKQLIIANQFATTSNETIAETWEINPYPHLTNTKTMETLYGNVNQLIVYHQTPYLYWDKTNILQNIYGDNAQLVFPSLPEHTHIAVLTTTNDEYILAIETAPRFTYVKLPKSIVVDTSSQRLFAYEQGRLMHTFLVSTARKPWVTPEGDHTILEKLPWVRYAWVYGKDNPNNYDLGNVPWNLKFYPHIYIHYAPWHNNFGKPMSHGCVNVNLENMKWIYNWADVGVPVRVQP